MLMSRVYCFDKKETKGVNVKDYISLIAHMQYSVFQKIWRFDQTPLPHSKTIEKKIAQTNYLIGLDCC